MVSVGAVAGVMVVLSFVLAMLCVFIRRSREAPGAAHDAAVLAATVATGAPHGTAAATARGLDEGIVQSLPLYQLPSSLVFISPEPCPICLSSFLQGQFVRVLPGCCHTFHLSCIDQWFSSHSNCPICRSHISLPP